MIESSNISVIWYNGTIDDVTNGCVLYMNGQYYSKNGIKYGIIDETGILPEKSKPTEI